MMGMRWMVSLLILSNFVLLSHFLSPVSAQTPTFEEADCPFQTPLGQDVDCGYLTVPENRTDPASPSLRLPVAIFRAENPAADPIFYLEGGPGGSALNQMETAFDLVFKPLIRDRDLVVMEQRGTRLAEPTLTCPEADQIVWDTLNQTLTLEEEAALQLQATAACHQRLTGEGINLDAYNSAENAADFEDLRQALGYEQVNLYGISYGTRLALTIARDFPKGIRSITLDSSYPLQQDLYAGIAPNFDRAMQALFADCAADAACHAAYPDLENTLFQTVERLNAQPASLQGQSLSSLESYDLLLTGDRLVGFLFQAFYQSGWLPYIPQMIHAAAQDDFDLLTTLYIALLEGGESVSYGMNLSVQCHDEIPFSPFVEIPNSELARLQDYLNRQANLGETLYDAFALWNPAPNPDPRENLPVSTAIPSLIIAGAYDPITPPAWGEEIQADLSQSYFFTYSNAAHGASVSGDCPIQMMLDFWQTPNQSPDASCLEDIPALDFAIVGEAIAVEFIPFEDDSFGIRGIRPAEWQEFTAGTYIRPGLYDTGLVQLSMPNLGLEMVLGLFLGQLGIEGDPTPIDNREANGLNWEIYTAATQGQSITIGAAEDGDLLLMIFLQARPAENQALYEGVFLPALDALVTSDE